MCDQVDTHLIGGVKIGYLLSQNKKFNAMSSICQYPISTKFAVFPGQ